MKIYIKYKKVEISGDFNFWLKKEIKAFRAWEGSKDLTEKEIKEKSIERLEFRIKICKINKKIINNNKQ